MERSSEATPESKSASPRVAGALLRYMAPIFVGAFLLFQVQPIIARCILPWFGGTPSVWTTCMLFFQILLLGYAYAHLVVSRRAPRAQAVVHTRPGRSSRSSSWRRGSGALRSSPASRGSRSRPQSRSGISSLLAVTVGLPYLVLATTSPLLQAWFSRRFRTARPTGSTPSRTSVRSWPRC